MEDMAGMTRVQVEKYASEDILKVLVVLVSLGIWFFAVISIIGIAYGIMIAMFLFITHLGFIAYLRGSAVKLGPEQFPELYDVVCAQARRLGMEKVPDAYLMQMGGSLNALATKFFGVNFVVLYADLLEACGDDTDARNMIIGHELGHIKAGHLWARWFLAPGLFMPVLGTAYSRACEYTCDRYGLALCGNTESAVRGMTILAAGGRYGPQVNLQAYVQQREQMQGGLMSLGRWFMTHPPLTDRVAALDRSFDTGAVSYTAGRIKAAVLIMLVWILPMAGMVAAFTAFSHKMKEKAKAQAAQKESTEELDRLYSE